MSKDFGEIISCFCVHLRVYVFNDVLLTSKFIWTHRLKRKEIIILRSYIHLCPDFVNSKDFIVFVGWSGRILFLFVLQFDL